ncbi:MAG: RHS repeat-associated protein [Arcticibacterium sp.]
MRLKRNLKTTARAIFYNKTQPYNFGWQMYDTPFRSYDAQLGRFHQIDPLADLAPGINPYRFGFNNPISLNDPTGLYEGSIQDIFDEAWARTSGDVGYFTFNNGSLNRDTSTENDINWVVDFVTSGQGTAEFVMDSGGGGFWLHYNPSFVGGYVGSRNEHVGAIIQKRSRFFRLGAQNGGGGDGELMASVATFALGAAVADGPLPIGDVVGLVAIGATAIYIHANSNQNPNPHLVYEIFSTSAGGSRRTEKFGITSRQDNVDGNNGRPAGQVNKFNRLDPSRAYGWQVVTRTQGRMSAKTIETFLVTQYAVRNGGSLPPKQIYPLPQMKWWQFQF